MHTTSDNHTPRQPALMRVLVRSWEYRRPSAWVRARIALGIWNLVLGVLLVALGYWLAAIPLVGAALIFWTANRLQHSVQT
jgi:hypothetical protein